MRSLIRCMQCTPAKGQTRHKAGTQSHGPSAYRRQPGYRKEEGMLRRRALALVFGAFVAIAAATAASAQGRHLMGSTITSVQHSIGVSSGSHEGSAVGTDEDQQGEDNDDQGE